MRIGVYPGSFDPVTKGHMDIIRRAAGIFDVLVVGVLCNSAKQPLFTASERKAQLESLTEEMPGVRVAAFDGLLGDFAREQGASYIVRGLRSGTDFDYEMPFAQGIPKLFPGQDTVFFMADSAYAYISSSLVKEIAMHGGDITSMVPQGIAEKVYERFQDKN